MATEGNMKKKKWLSNIVMYVIAKIKEQPSSLLVVAVESLSFVVHPFWPSVKLGWKRKIQLNPARPACKFKKKKNEKHFAMFIFGCSRRKKKHYNSELDEKVRNKFFLYNIFLYDIIILFIFAFTKYFATYKIKKNIEL